MTNAKNCPFKAASPEASRAMVFFEGADFHGVQAAVGLETQSNPDSQIFPRATTGIDIMAPSRLLKAECRYRNRRHEERQ